MRPPNTRRAKRPSAIPKAIARVLECEGVGVALGCKVEETTAVKGVMESSGELVNLDDEEEAIGLTEEAEEVGEVLEVTVDDVVLGGIVDDGEMAEESIDDVVVELLHLRMRARWWRNLLRA